MIDVDTDSPLDAMLRAFAKQLVLSETPMIDVRIIAQHVLDLDDAGLILAGPTKISQPDAAQLCALIARRAAGEPVAYIVGEKEFRSLTFKIAPGILVPRPDSETIIDACEARREKHRPLKILDLGVGSGCLLISLLRSFPKATGVGVDLNISAAKLAQCNAARLGVGERASIIAGEWMSAVRGRYDMIVSNPPYISVDDAANLSKDITDFEDPRALYAGADGLDAYREIVPNSGNYLAVDGIIVLEVGQGQSSAVEGLARDCYPDARISTRSDLSGIPRAVIIDNQL